MKKLNKLQINPEKLIKNEELLTLKGGDWSGYCEVICPTYYFNGPSNGPTCQDAQSLCTNYWNNWEAGCYCICNCGGGY